jgi:hypothetical protein
MGFDKSKRGILAPSFKGDISACTKMKPSTAQQFMSNELTGTGAVQNVAHGLGAVPVGVFVSTSNTTGSTKVFVVTEGAHTTTNIVLTVTAGAKFKVLAYL